MPYSAGVISSTLCLAAPAIGSFIACAADRIPRDESILFARSRCRSCRGTLAPIDLVPLLSFVALRGHCRQCRSPIPALVVAAEFIALTAAIPLLSLPGPTALFGGVLAALLIALSMFDLQHGRLPNLLTALLAAASLGPVLFGAIDWRDSAIGGCVGFCLPYAAAVVFRAIAARDGLGGGDIKLYGALGLWVGWQGFSLLLLASSLLGLVIGIAIGLHRRPAAKLPFGPCIAISGFCLWVAQQLS